MKKKNSTKKEIKVVGNMTFGEAIYLKSDVGKVLAEEGMFCGCCPRAMMETIEHGAKAHGIDINKLLKKLNE